MLAACGGDATTTRDSVADPAELLPGSRGLDHLRLPAGQGECGAPPSAFDTGYVDVFAARLRKLSPKIQVVNYGCPGESTVTFTRGGCPWLAEGKKLHDAFRGSQLEAALSFLRAHPGQVSPITLTLWGNDLASAVGRKASARRSAIASVASRLKSILQRLRVAAPTAEIIVTGAWNPEVDQLDAGPAALPLARCGHRTSRGGVARPCCEHVCGLQSARERPYAASSALRDHLYLLEGRCASDRRRVPRDGRGLHGCVGLSAEAVGP